MRAISVLRNAKSNCHRRTHEVELDGAGRKYKPLPGEISSMRVGEKSAKSVVVKMPAERQAERRDEESRERGTSRTHCKRRAGGRKMRGVATAAATPCGAGCWMSGFSSGRQGWLPSRKRWCEGTRRNVMSTRVGFGLHWCSRAGREAALAGLNRRMRKTARTVVWED